jgi:hypothetical protein
MTDMFVIKDLDHFIDSTRKLVFNSFGKQDASNQSINQMLYSDMSESDINEMDRVLSISETEIIIKNRLKKQKNKTTGEHRYILTESQFCDIVEDLNSRMVSNLLSELAAKGMIESAYDSELNDFVFWIKDDEQTKEDNTSS